MKAQLDYIDALRIPGIGCSKTIKTIDELLGGAILAASAATGQLGLVSLLEARDELVLLSDKLITNFGERIRGARGKSRADLLVATHPVLIINAYFQALNEADTSLLDSGILDSLSLLRLVVFLEQRFGITMGKADLLPENSASAKAICGYLRAREPGNQEEAAAHG